MAPKLFLSYRRDQTDLSAWAAALADTFGLLRANFSLSSLRQHDEPRSDVFKLIDEADVFVCVIGSRMELHSQFLHDEFERASSRPGPRPMLYIDESTRERCASPPAPEHLAEAAAAPCSSPRGVGKGIMGAMTGVIGAIRGLQSLVLVAAALLAHLFTPPADEPSPDWKKPGHRNLSMV
jgi:hypothetical protein